MCLDAEPLQELFNRFVFILNQVQYLVLAEGSVQLFISMCRIDQLRGDFLASNQIIPIQTEANNPDQLAFFL